MKKTIVVILLVMLSFIAFSHLKMESAIAKEDLLVPDFALVSSAGETVRLSDYKGQIVVLNFWASWCPPCREEMGDFQKLHDRFEETGEAVLLLLNQIDGRRETTTSGVKYLEDNEYTLTNLLDYGQVGAGIFGVPGLPTTVVIDAEGYLATHVVGGINDKIVLDMIEVAK